MKFLNWSKPPDSVYLNDNEIHAWLVNLKLEKDVVENIKHILAANEIEKANNFYFEKDKNAFVVAHVGLRMILSKYLNTLPQNIVFTNNKYGKPFLASSKVRKISFNLSHSKDFALFGITPFDKIGVDIEYIKDNFVTMDIANNYFSKSEIEDLFNLPKEKQQIGFFYCWTRKEAYIKAEGKGLSIPLDSFDVKLERHAPKITRIKKVQNPQNWNLYNLEMNSDYCAAIANYGNKKEIINYFIGDISKL